MGVLLIWLSAKKCSLFLPLTDATIAKILGTIARTYAGLDNSQNVYTTFRSALGGNTVLDMPSLNSWNVDVLVDSIRQLAPGINWINVMENLDHEGFYIPNEAAFSFFMSIYKHACQEPFPLHTICGSIWKNVEGQLSFLKNAVAAPPEVFTFAHSERQLSGPNRAWSCHDLLVVLCQLSEMCHASFVRSVIESPLNNFPEVLLLGMAHVNTAYNLIQNEVASAVLPMALKRASTCGLLYTLWHVNQNMLLRGLIETVNLDPDSVTRFLDAFQEIKDLSPSHFQPLGSLLNIYLEACPIVLKVLQSHAGVLSANNLSEEIKKLDVSHMHANSRMESAGGSDVAADSYADDFETEANSYFHQMFSGHLSIDDMIQMLTRFKESPDKREQSVYECMIANLFEEYKFFSKYPERQLRIAAVLLGLVAFIERALNRISAAHSEPDLGHSANTDHHQGLIQSSAPNMESRSGAGLSIQSASSSFSRSSRSASAKSGSAFNIETLVAAAERRETPIELDVAFWKCAFSSNDVPYEVSTRAPASEAQDKISFIINNLSTANVEVKAKELSIGRDTILGSRSIWVSIEPNFQDLYLKFLDKVNLKPLNIEIVQATYENCKALLGSELIKSSVEERSLLKNLGSWPGKITIGKNKVLRAREMDPKALIIEILVPCLNSIAYGPPNPWTLGILGLLAEIYVMPNLKMNLKFEIEVLFMHLSVDLKDVTPTSLLKDIVPEVEADLVLCLSYAAAVPHSSGTLTEDEKLVNLGYSDQLPSAQGLLQGQSQYPVNQVPVTAANIEHQVVVKGFRLMAYTCIFRVAMDRAVKEIVSGIVPCSVSIATDTTKELVLKLEIQLANEAKEVEIQITARPESPESLQQLIEIAMNPANAGNLSPSAVGKEEIARTSRDKKLVEPGLPGTSSEEFNVTELVDFDAAGFSEQYREFSHTPLLKVFGLFAEWYHICELPGANDVACARHVSLLQQRGQLKGDDMTDRFFRRIMVRNSLYHIVYKCEVSFLSSEVWPCGSRFEETFTSAKVLALTVKYILKDAEERKASFNPRSYFRLFVNWLLDLCSLDPVFEGGNFQALTALANSFHAIQPLKVPGFSFAWLELVSHRSFMPKLLTANAQKGWPYFQRLLVDLFQFMEPFLRKTELEEPVQFLYKGTLRVFCIQMRNIILSAFRRNMRLPDPSTPNLKMDLLAEINHTPRILSDVDTALKAKQIKDDVEEYLKTRQQGSPFLSDAELKQKLLLSSSDAACAGTRYNAPLINSLVLYVGMQQLQARKPPHAQTMGNMSAFLVSAALDVFQTDLDREGRYLFLNAIANQLHYPNNHTHYFSSVLLYLFAESNQGFFYTIELKSGDV
ncbi:hypothetical protein SASPL_112256 [Salvia splendens]|uniref:CCR4-NOT transcription complex subunit 1 n=1 Tax=Salvia splendens TaxID=180675 RepID=A0A8X9A4E4_SALSN|nr:hypothetical protein SASPL_112256 [Salvia splendens]